MLDNFKFSFVCFWILLNSFKECRNWFWYKDKWLLGVWSMKTQNTKLCFDRLYIDLISGTNVTPIARLWHVYQNPTQHSLYYKVFLLQPVATQIIYSLCELWAVLLISGSCLDYGSLLQHSHINSTNALRVSILDSSMACLCAILVLEFCPIKFSCLDILKV